MKLEEWGKTGYDDLLRKYRVGKSHLYEIITTNYPGKVAKKLKKGKEVIMEFRKRHEIIVGKKSKNR